MSLWSTSIRVENEDLVIFDFPYILKSKIKMQLHLNQSTNDSFIMSIYSISNLNSLSNQTKFINNKNSNICKITKTSTRNSKRTSPPSNTPSNNNTSATSSNTQNSDKSSTIFSVLVYWNSPITCTTTPKSSSPISTTKRTPSSTSP